MSYIRWGERGSNVYLIGIDDWKVVCVGCDWAEPGGAGLALEAMLAHLERHVAAGHVVPAQVFERIEADIAERDKENKMTKVYVLFNPGYDEDGGGDECGKVIGVFSSRADAGRVQRVHSEADIEECKLDELAGHGVVTEWVVAINGVTGRIDGCGTEEVFGHTDFVPYGRSCAGFEARSRTSLEHAMKVAEEGGRRWLAPAPVESRSLEVQPNAVATCFYCYTGNNVKSSGDATGPAPNLWGYARDGAGELLCCSRCLADYHAGQPVKLVPMEHAADGKPEPAMAGGKATHVEPWVSGSDR